MIEWGHVPWACRLARPQGPSDGTTELRAGHQATKSKILPVGKNVLGKHVFPRVSRLLKGHPRSTGLCAVESYITCVCLFQELCVAECIDLSLFCRCCSFIQES